MNDKELLENAAKAAGLEIKTKFYEIGGWHAWWRHVISEGNEEWIGWNPLTDDGDALRLAVQLKILVDIGVDSSEATNGDYICHGICELHRNSDPYAATRRAIVRAAAEIGKAK